jgi:Holliday junction resolvase RusA-like endonuclease
MRELMFIVEGEPVPKGRPRFTRANGFARTYTPQKTRDAEGRVAYSAHVAMQQQKTSICAVQHENKRDVAVQQKNARKNAVKVSIEFFLKIPKSISRKSLESNEVMPTVKPDLDNLAKTVLDGMNGIVYQDDSQIVELHISKKYSDHPCTVVRVSPI